MLTEENLMQVNIHKYDNGDVSIDLIAVTRKDRQDLQHVGYQKTFQVVATEEKKSEMITVCLNHTQKIQKRYERGKEAE